MERTIHCRLCEHQIFSFEEGTVCGLTHRKPDFQRVCNKIEFGETFKEKITEANVAYKEVTRNKTKVYRFFTTHILLGIGVLIAIYFGMDYLMGFWDQIHGKAILVYAFPFVFLGFAFKYFMEATKAMAAYKSELKKALYKKNQVDTIAELYHKPYTIDITFEEEPNGDLTPNINLEIKDIR